MEDETTSQGRQIVAVAFDPATPKDPALLDIAVRREDGSIETITLLGRAAKRLSHLKVGDYYRDAPNPE